MKTALIMGIGGGFGGHVAKQLQRDGWRLKTLIRSDSKLAAPFQDVDAIVGDAADREAIARAADGVDVIVYGINPRYDRWEQDSMPLLENMLSVAEKQRLLVVFPGNVYIYPANGKHDIDESEPTQVTTGKGKIRLAMEQRLRKASQHGAKVMIIRCGDFIGKNAPSTWLYRLIKKTAKGYRVSATGARDLLHSWAYLPDVAVTVSKLLTQGRLSAFEVFHFAGHRISFNDIAMAIENISGEKVKMTSFPWPILRLLSPFSAMMRSVLEMRYLWQQPLNLNQARLQQRLQDQVPHTRLEKVLVDSGLLDVAFLNSALMDSELLES